MKRLLATVLAALMLFGAFAVGVGAIDDDEPAVLQAGEFDALTSSQKVAFLALLAKFTTYMDKEQVTKAVALVFALQASQGVEDAMRDPAKLAEFNGLVAAALGTVDMVNGDVFDELISAFIGDSEAAAVAAFLAGTLPQQLKTLFGAFLTNFIGEVQPLVDGYVKQQIVDNAKDYANLAVDLPWALFTKSGLSEETKASIKAQLLQLRKSIDVKATLRKSAVDYEKAIDDLVINSRKAVAAVKAWVLTIRERVPEWQRNWPAFLQWFYYYILFGWVSAIFA